MGILANLYKEDLKDRKSRNLDKASKEELAWLNRRDKQRKDKVIALNKDKKIKTASDFHCAALILQHGNDLKDFKIANKFAEKAIKLGDESARWLYAATLDRWLLSTGKPQKFGTQFQQDKKGEWQLIEPVDPATTDDERAKYGTPPIAQALQKFKEKYNLG